MWAPKLSVTEALWMFPELTEGQCEEVAQATIAEAFRSQEKRTAASAA